MTKHEEMANEFARYKKGPEFKLLDEHLLSNGFKRITRGKGLGYQQKVASKNVLAFVIRMNENAGDFSFSDPYWESKKGEIENFESKFKSFDINPVDRKRGTSSQFSMLQVRFNENNLELAVCEYSDFPDRFYPSG